MPTLLIVQGKKKVEVNEKNIIVCKNITLFLWQEFYQIFSLTQFTFFIVIKHKLPVEYKDKKYQDVGHINI